MSYINGSKSAESTPDLLNLSSFQLSSDLFVCDMFRYELEVEIEKRKSDNILQPLKAELASIEEEVNTH